MIVWQDRLADCWQEWSQRPSLETVEKVIQKLSPAVSGLLHNIMSNSCDKIQTLFTGINNTMTKACFMIRS